VEEVRSGAAGKQRAGPARLDRCQVARLEAWSGVADAEDTAMNGNQDAGGKSRAYLTIAYADPLQLGAAHDSV
jgi:hypothetical protein